MLYSTFVAVGVIAASVRAVPLHPDDDRTIITVFRRNSTAALVPRQSGGAPVIKVYWNIVTVNGEGDVTEERIKKQMDDLNADFGPVGIHFELAGADGVKKVPAPDKSWWAQLCDGGMQSGGIMKQTRSPDAAKRDVVSIWTGSQCDMAQLPFGYDTNPDGDGIAFGYGDVSEVGQAAAHALTHEVGHWAGLPHTFKTNSDECGDGDGVDDTPPHMDPTSLQQSRPSGCPAVKTCTGEMSDVLGSNYMNYVNDECRKSFTPGQIKSMQKTLWEIRGVQFPGVFSDETFSTTPPEGDADTAPNPAWPIGARGTWVYQADFDTKEVRPKYDATLTRERFDKIEKRGWRKGVVVQLGKDAEYEYYGGEKNWQALFTQFGLKYNPAPLGAGDTGSSSKPTSENPESKGGDAGSDKGTGSSTGEDPTARVTADGSQTSPTPPGGDTTGDTDKPSSGSASGSSDGSSQDTGTSTDGSSSSTKVTAVPSGQYKSLAGLWVNTVSEHSIDRTFDRTLQPSAFDDIVTAGRIIGTPKGGGVIAKIDGSLVWVSQDEFRNRYSSYEGYDAQNVAYEADYYVLA